MKILCTYLILFHLEFKFLNNLKSNFIYIVFYYVTIKIVHVRILLFILICQLFKFFIFNTLIYFANKSSYS